MKEQDLEKKLKRALHQPYTIANEKHFENTILLVKEEACQKKKRERISFSRFLIMQTKYIGWKIWSIQGIFLLFISYLLTCFYDYRESPQFVAKLLFCFSILLFMTALPFIYRSVHYQMQEIEAATRFSSVKLLMAKLIIIGIGDVFMMSGIFFTTIVKTSLQADCIILYLCFPFLLVSSGCLFMLGHFTPKHFLTGSIGLCLFFMIIIPGILGQYEVLFQQSFSVSMKDGRLLAKGTTEELVKMIDGKVWTALIPMDCLPEYEHKLQIVNLRNEENNQISIRYLAEEPYTDNSQPATPHLEDLYLWMFPQETSDRR